MGRSATARQHARGRERDSFGGRRRVAASTLRWPPMNDSTRSTNRPSRRVRPIIRGPRAAEEFTDAERKGPLYIPNLIDATRLDANLKTALRSLAKFANWNDGGGIYASNATLGEVVSRTDRTISRQLHRLEALGLIVCESRSKGGRSTGHLGKTNRWRINVDLLRELAAAAKAPKTLPGLRPDQPRNPCKSTQTSAPFNPDTFSDNRMSNHVNSPPSPSPPFNAARQPSGGQGGGGGECSHSREAKECTPGPANAQSLPDGLCNEDSNLESRKLLREFGVWEQSVDRLARECSPELIRFAIGLMKARKVPANDPPGALVTMLKGNTARVQFEIRRRKQSEQRRKRCVTRLNQRFDEYISRFGHDLPASIQQELALVRSRWPAAEDVVDSRILSEKDLSSEHVSTEQILRILVSAAERTQACGPRPKRDTGDCSNHAADTEGRAV
jgi:hypothetical protein